MKDIPGYEGLYAATEDGKIFSYKKKSFIDPNSYTRNGYKQIQLWKNGKATNYKWHRLIAMTFIPNPNNLPQVDHINNDKTDNRVANLQWISNVENNRKKETGIIPRRVQCIETGEIYESAAAAARAFNRKPMTMSQHLRGEHKTCAGLHFKYEDVV